MKIAVLIHEPYFTTKIRELADRFGSDVNICKSIDDLPPAVEIAFVDLGATEFDPVREISKLKSQGRFIPVIAFLTSVQVDMRERAEKAGADEVAFRSTMLDRIETALQEGR